MGNVAVGAGLHLAQQLDMRLAHELPALDHFDFQQIEVDAGLVAPLRVPRSLIYQPKEPDPKHDLLVFAGEAQPTNARYQFCQRLLDEAQSRGVEHLYTFASLATQLHPSQDPRVFGVATDRQTLEPATEHNVAVLEEGQIGGLNGLLLAAAAERGIPGLCLLGEIPFFAAGIPNPKASLAVLRVFCEMTGLVVDLTELESQAEAAHEHLMDLLERLTEAARAEGEVPEFVANEPESDVRKPALEPAAIARIERLFEEAEADRAKAFALKEELDRLGVFADYEDRFLDLFRRAE